MECELYSAIVNAVVDGAWYTVYSTRYIYAYGFVLHYFVVGIF